jgi:RNA-directed DNA polymerase
LDSQTGLSGETTLGIPAVRDRVVQAVVRHVLEPIFEQDFDEQIFGFRPNWGCKDALGRVDLLLKVGCAWVVDVDDFVILYAVECHRL